MSIYNTFVKQERTLNMIIKLCHMLYQEDPAHRIARLALRDLMVTRYETTEAMPIRVFSNHLQRLQFRQDPAFWAKSSNITVHAHHERFIRRAVARGSAWLARARLPGYDGDPLLGWLSFQAPRSTTTTSHDFWIDNEYFDDNFTEIYSSAQGLVHLKRVLADPVLTAYYRHVVANICVSGIKNVIAPTTAARFIQGHIETSVVGGEDAFDTIIESILPSTRALDKSVLRRSTVRITNTNP
ncbi:hypothetical protein LTR17_007262 [Elasticomyces elasticus]|nr:hypothetical protein LTR17_007262 [Elasticomyces elasticus]